MIKGIYIGSKGLEMRMKNLDSVANNIANINSTGYKRQVPFIEVLNAEGQINIKQITDLKQGELINSSNPLDTAISGKGFFTVKGDNGIELTRNGRFKLSEEGYLVNESGMKVMGLKGAIDLAGFLTEKENSITISKDGEVRAGDNLIDTLFIADSENPGYLERSEGANFVSMTELKSAAPGDYEILQGYVEESNVNPILEMESMLQLNKDYEASQRVMNHLDESLSKAAEIGRI